MNQFKDDPTFIVMGKLITLISDQGCYGLNTVAYIDDFFHYIGDEHPNLSAAIFTWQEINGRLLTAEEIKQVMLDNNIQLGEIDDHQEEHQEITQEN